jgi:hypothetical protein
MESVNKEHKQEIMKRVLEAGDPDNYETSWEDGVPKSKKKINIARGRLSRAQGARFELKVREELESRGWIVDKWTNNLEEGKLVKAKRKYNPFQKMLVVGTGFPDFIAFKKIGERSYSIIGVEVKMNGILSKVEKEKCALYLKKEIFSRILIAKKGEKKGKIEYIDFEEKYRKKYDNL